MKDLKEVIRLVTLEKKDILLSILFGFLAGLSAVGLFASSGYLISKAALLPPLYALTVLIAFLKLFGFARALGRYAERYFSHRATFSILSHLRVTFYKRLEPIAPRLFQKYRSGDLLARIVGRRGKSAELFPARLLSAGRARYHFLRDDCVHVDLFASGSGCTAARPRLDGSCHPGLVQCEAEEIEPVCP